MVNTNMWANEGGSITLTALPKGGEEYAGMLLLCGPLYWSWKQGGQEMWELGRGPETVKITAAVDLGSPPPLVGTSGTYKRGLTPHNENPHEPDGFWAISIPLTTKQFESLQGKGPLNVTGTKEYEDGFESPDATVWIEPLPVRVALP